jgi:hypothetical protein
VSDNKHTKARLVKGTVELSDEQENKTLKESTCRNGETCNIQNTKPQHGTHKVH